MAIVYPATTMGNTMPDVGQKTTNKGTAPVSSKLLPYWKSQQNREKHKCTILLQIHISVMKKKAMQVNDAEKHWPGEEDAG